MDEIIAEDMGGQKWKIEKHRSNIIKGMSN